MTIERVTITVKRDILKRIDSLIDGKEFKNRSHAVERMLLKALMNDYVDTAVIMAGGRGTRLRPITYEKPKAMIPIHGKPILEHQINMLKKFDIRNIILSVGYKNEKIIEYFGDGSRFGVNIKYAVEGEPLGTAGPLKKMESTLGKAFVLLNVDTLMNPDVHLMYDFHKKQNALITMLLVTTDDPSSYGAVRMRGSQILEFVEKPKSGKAPSNLVNAGMMIIEPDALKFIPNGRYMLEDVYRKAARTGRLYGFPHDKKIYDVGTHERYEKAIKEWKNV